METVLKPVQAHGERGRVERAIKTIRSIMKNTTICQTKHSVLGWETLFASFANMINNLPIARTNSSTQGNRGEADEILTPNRLILGRNNVRSLEKLDRSGTDLDGIFEKNLKIQRNFYELLMKNVFELVPQPKWYKSDNYLKVGDIVLYVHKESAYTSDHFWRLGRVREIIAKTKPVKAVIEYRNVG